jgi:tetratricopeptide (TPR) repeat protein/transglutaminase-like putative cysteine protease
MTNWTLAFFVSTVLLAWPDPCPGQITESTIGAAEFEPVETALFADEAKLRRHDAIERSLAELRARTAAKTTGDRGRREAAFVEYLALRLVDLVSGFSDPRRIRAQFAELVDSPLARTHPTLRDTLAIQVMTLHHMLGDATARTTLRRELGFIHGWWTIGPFDNERGSGFNRAFGLETELVLDKSYKGKKRDVHWRPLPYSPTRGWINLRASVRPSRQIMCFVATCLFADADKEVALRLGSSEAFEVFLNGKNLGGRSLRRRFEYDQDTIVLPLRAGANLLMLRIFTQEGGLAFAARLRALDMGPVGGVTVQTGKPELLAAAKQQPRQSAKTSKPYLGGRDAFGRETADAGPADALRLASILGFYHADDDTDPRVQDLVRAAVKGFPDEPAVRFALARTRIRDRIAAAKEENPRRHDYQAILAARPAHGPTLLALARMDLRSTGAATQAERLLKRARVVHPADSRLRLATAAVLDKSGLPQLARIELEKAAAPDAHGNFLTSARRRVAQTYLREGRLRESLRSFRTLAARERNTADNLSRVTILLHTGKRDAAVKLLEETITSSPLDTSPRFRLSRLLEAEGNVTQAMRPLQTWLTICPEDDNALIELARLYGMLGQVDRQRELLRSAITLNPNRKKDRRRLEFLKADEKPFYAEHEVDSAAVIAKDRGAPADTAAANDPFYYLMDQRVVHAYRNGTTSEYRHFMLRILNNEGSKRFARYRVPFYWGEQRARLLSVRIHEKTGRVRRPRLYGATVALPSLSAGDTVEVRYRIDDTAPGFFGDYFGFEHRFSHRNPTNISSLAVVLEKGREYRLQAANGAPRPTVSEDAAGNRVWRFEMRDLARAKNESRQPGASESEPLIRITTYASWNAFASWWWNLIRDQIEVSPGIRAKVTELTKGLTTTQAKIDAIYRFVTTDVRYEAWEFGVHGYKPYSVPVIFERRHGDCKDKSLLMNSMLSLIGVDAYPVLIHANQTRSKDDLSLPMVNHFNHCISFVAATDDTPAMFLDGTATYHPVGTLPDMDRGAEVLVVRGPKGDILQIPWPKSDANRDTFRFHIAIEPNGDAEIRYRSEPTLNRAVWVRSYLGNEPAKRREHLEQILQRDFGTIEIKKFDVGDLLDLSKPVNVSVSFRAKRFAVAQGKGLVLKSALGAERLAPYALAEERRKPLLLGIPGSTVHTIEYALPSGYDALNLPAPTSLKSEFGTFYLAWERKPGALVASRRLRLTTQRIPPELYRAFREFATKVDQSSRQVVVIEKKGGER